MSTTVSGGYTDRQQAEKRWHDEKYRHEAKGETRRIDRASRRFWEIVGRPTGLTILDFGCGDGWLSVSLARQGNRLHGFDISESLIARAKEAAAKANVGDRATFKEMAAESLDYPNDSFDMVIGTSILHHTDLEVTLDRLNKVLKSGGTAIFLEPLNQNLALRIWRLLTPWRRTETERAFTREDVSRVRQFFPGTRFSYYCLTSMFTTGLLLFAPRSRVLSFTNDLLEAVDERVLAMFPGLGRLSAVVIMEMRK